LSGSCEHGSEAWGSIKGKKGKGKVVPVLNEAPRYEDLLES
jgi:hypothetical protein